MNTFPFKFLAGFFNLNYTNSIFNIVTFFDNYIIKKYWDLILLFVEFHT